MLMTTPIGGDYHTGIRDWHALHSGLIFGGPIAKHVIGCSHRVATGASVTVVNVNATSQGSDFASKIGVVGVSITTAVSIIGVK